MAKEHEPWSKEFATEYWNATSYETYEALRELQYDKFDMNHHGVCFRDAFGETTGIAIIDVGGGAYGGMLYYAPIEANRILADKNIKNYPKFYKPWVDVAVEADCLNLPFQDDYADILFALALVDHLNTRDEVAQAKRELIRVLKPGGLLFFGVPIRQNSRDGHLVFLPTVDIALEGFDELEELRAGSVTIESHWAIGIYRKPK